MHKQGVALTTLVCEAQGQQGVIVYSTKSFNGVLTIQRNGRNVLAVWDENWEFANEICDLLNSREDDPQIFLTEHDRKWLKAMDRAFSRSVHHV